MSFMIENDNESVVSIKVVGVGGGGGNAVNRMIEEDVKGVDFISVNTDKQILKYAKSNEKLTIGDKLTKGRGAGGNPDKGQRAAEESREEISAVLKGAQMVFITAGMGGGTGTGAAPVIAEIAKEMGILTIGIVTRPFSFEGKKRQEQADLGIASLREHVDALVVIPNDRLRYISEEPITLANAFAAADDVLKQGVESISALMNVPGLINLDFADVNEVMHDAGYAHMGVAKAVGKDKARDAAQQAITSPLLETSIDGAKGVIINITASTNIGFDDVDIASTMIQEAAHPDANIIWGVVFDEDMQDEMQVTVIATGFESPGAGGFPSYTFKSQTGKDKQGQDSLDDDFGAIMDLFNKK